MLPYRDCPSCKDLSKCHRRAAALPRWNLSKTSLSAVIMAAIAIQPAEALDYGCPGSKLRPKRWAETSTPASTTCVLTQMRPGRRRAALWSFWLAALQNRATVAHNRADRPCGTGRSAGSLLARPSATRTPVALSYLIADDERQRSVAMLCLSMRRDLLVDRRSALSGRGREPSHGTAS